MKRALVLLVFLASALSFGQFDPSGMMRDIQFSPVNMLMMPDVKKELKLAGDQNKQLDKIRKEYQKKLNDLSKGARNDPAAGMAMAKVMNEETDKSSEASMAVLNPDQAARLKQIQLQALGGTALYDEELQKELELTGEQIGKIDEFKQGQGSRMMEMMQGSRDPRAMQKKMKEMKELEETTLVKILTTEQSEKLKVKLGPPSAAAKKLREMSM